MEKELVKIAKLLNKHKIRYLLIGGYAAILYGVERATFDIDIAILSQSSEIKKTLSLLSKLKFIPIQSEIDLYYGMRLTDGKTKLDLMFIDEVRFNHIYNYHKKIQFKDTIIKLPNIMDLVYIKESSIRPKDIEDAITLRNIASARLKKHHA